MLDWLKRVFLEIIKARNSKKFFNISKAASNDRMAASDKDRILFTDLLVI